MSSVLHLCGAFLQCDDPAALSRWYAEAFGLALKEWGPGTCYGLEWPHTTPEGTQSNTIFSLQKAKTPLGATPRTCIVNLRVADLRETVAHLQNLGVPLEGPEESEYGRFAWIHDPEGNRLELYQP